MYDHSININYASFIIGNVVLLFGFVASLFGYKILAIEVLLPTQSVFLLLSLSPVTQTHSFISSL